MSEFVKNIKNINEDYSKWYTDVITKAKIIDYGPIKGTMVLRPYGYAIWENIKNNMNKIFKEYKIQNAYFPLLIPYSYIQKESHHIKGFAPELAFVYSSNESNETNEKEQIIIRPTSETIICSMYSKWLKSYRELPILINQWANVVRMEKTTRPLLRTIEFLWQEGHTAHATPQEAKDFTLKILNLYENFAKEYLAIPMLSGKKSEKEKFAGAEETYSIETFMPDGQCLQSGTSHYLGDNFSKAFDIKFLDKNEKLSYVYQTSFGTSTRLLAAIIMIHGDERGLRLPPKIAPTQIIIIPISKQETVIKKAKELYQKLTNLNFRVEIDERDSNAGYKFNEADLRGIPIRIDIGPKDIENNTLVVYRRDKKEKDTYSLEKVEYKIKKLLSEIQLNLYMEAKKVRDSKIIEVNDYNELKNAIMSNKFALGNWCGNIKCENKIKINLSAKTCNMPFEQNIGKNKKCCICGIEKSKYKIYIGRSY